MFLAGLVLNIVVHKRGYEQLKVFEDFSDRSLALSAFHVAPELVVGPDDHSVGVSQVIFVSCPISRLDRRPDGRRGNGQSLDHHPLGARLLGAET